MQGPVLSAQPQSEGGEEEVSAILPQSTLVKAEVEVSLRLALYAQNLSPKNSSPRHWERVQPLSCRGGVKESADRRGLCSHVGGTVLSVPHCISLSPVFQ